MSSNEVTNETVAAAPSDDGRVRYEKHGQTALITLDRPAKLNAYTPSMYEELTAAFDDFAADKELRVAVLTGAGERAFCAGADLGRTVSKMAEGGPRHFKDITKRFFSDIYKPIIGAVNGICIAGGLEILQGTDLRLGVEDAVFGLGEVRWGITPGGGSHVRLPRQIPWAVAMEILLTGRPISAERAREVGLINRIVPRESLIDEAMKLADTLIENAPLAVSGAKEAAVRAMQLETPFELEFLVTGQVLKTKDAQEGPRAFSEKRKPRWEGR